MRIASSQTGLLVTYLSGVLFTCNQCVLAQGANPNIHFLEVIMKKFSVHSVVLLCVVTTLLHVVPAAIAGPGSSAKLNGSFRDDADVEDYQISSDNQRVVYRADQDSLRF